MARTKKAPEGEIRISPRTGKPVRRYTKRRKAISGPRKAVAAPKAQKVPTGTPKPKRARKARRKPSTGQNGAVQPQTGGSTTNRSQRDEILQLAQALLLTGVSARGEIPRGEAVREMARIARTLIAEIDNPTESKLQPTRPATKQEREAVSEAPGEDGMEDEESAETNLEAALV